MVSGGPVNEYELMYVLHPRLTPEEIEASVERISALVTDRGGEILSVDQWGRRRLAYPIDRNLEGFYVLSTFVAASDVCGPLETQLNLSEDVLRHLLIRGIIPYDEPPRDERVQSDRERSSRRSEDRPPSGDDGSASSLGADNEGTPDEDLSEALATADEVPVSVVSEEELQSVTEEAQEPTETDAQESVETNRE